MQFIAAFSALPAPVRATLLMCTAMVFFTSMGIFIRLASENLHVLEVVFFRNFLAVVLMAPWIMQQGLGALRTERYGLYSLRAAINLAAMAAGFAAITMIPLAEATALGFTAPLFATLLAMLFLGEVVRLRRWIAILIGFAGTLVIIRPGMVDVGLGPLLILAATVVWSFALIIIKFLTRTESSVTITVYASIFVVNEREQAIVLRFGEIQDVKTEPGLYFKAPFAFAGFDTVQIIEDRLLRLDLSDQPPVQVSGGRFYEVDAFLTFRIDDARKFRETVSGDLTSAASRLRTRFDSALRRVYGLRSFEAALSEERAEMMREVRDQIRPEAQALGLSIEDVRIVRTDLTAEVSQQTFDRMKAERLAEAERIRARGRETAQRIRAVADRQVIEIVAEAQREAEIARGKGDAERNRVFAEAFNRDPEFFEFYRSMSAYQRALESSDTTMVLSPNSEFFKFFKDAAGTAPSGAGDAAQ